MYRAVDQQGQVIDVYVSQRRDIASARGFFTAARAVHGGPPEVITDRAPALANVVEALVPAAWHNTGQDENTSTRTTGSSATTAACRHGSGRCAD
jgi:transposase-like protein